jgi:Ring finger domain
MRATRRPQELGPLNYPPPPNVLIDQKLLTINEVNEHFPAIMYRELKERRGEVGGGNREDPPEIKARSHSDADHNQPSTKESAAEDQRNDQHLNPNPPAETDDAAEKIPQPRPLPTESCAICLEYLEDDDDIRELRCRHYFHQPCIDQWLTARRGQCPLCKRDCVDSEPRRRSIEPSPPPRTAITRIYSRFSSDAGIQTRDGIPYRPLQPNLRSQSP